MLSEIALSQKIMYGLSLYPFLLGGFGEGEGGGAGFGEGSEEVLLLSGSPA